VAKNEGGKVRLAGSVGRTPLLGGGAPFQTRRKVPKTLSKQKKKKTPKKAISLQQTKGKEVSLLFGREGGKDWGKRSQKKKRRARRGGDRGERTKQNTTLKKKKISGTRGEKQKNPRRMNAEHWASKRNGDGTCGCKGV